MYRLTVIRRAPVALAALIASLAPLAAADSGPREAPPPVMGPEAQPPVQSDDLALALDQVPQPVRDQLERQAAGKRITSITRETDDGAVVYSARIEQRGLDRRLSINERGSIVSDRRFAAINQALGKASDEVDAATGRAKEAWNHAVGGSGDPLALDQLPPPARERIQQEANGNRIAAVHGDTEEGKLFYRATIRFEDGSDRVIKVSEDGQLLSWKRAKDPDERSASR